MELNTRQRPPARLMNRAHSTRMHKEAMVTIQSTRFVTGRAAGNDAIGSSNIPPWQVDSVVNLIMFKSLKINDIEHVCVLPRAGKIKRISNFTKNNNNFVRKRSVKFEVVATQ